MAIKERVEKLEVTIGNGSAQEKVFTLPGVRISILENEAVSVLYSGEVISAAFVDALLKERFPHAVASIALPCNHRLSTLWVQLGCLIKEPEETYE